MADKDEIEYFFLTEDHFDEVVAQLNEDFFPREPITLGIYADDKCQAGKGRVGEDVRRCLKTGISVGARDRKTGKLVGIRGCVLVESSNPQKPTEPANEFEMEYRIMEHVMGQVYTLEKAEKILMLMFLSVRKEYCGRGIAGKMVEKCMKAGYEKGAQVACTCISNIMSRRVFEKLGYEIRYTLDYEDPAYDFKVDLSRMDGNDRCWLMTKTLP